MVFCVWALSVLAAAPAPAAAPDLRIEGASVYESASAAPRQATIVTRGGRILFVGDAARARELAPHAAVIEIPGAFVFPGWADAHGHLSGLGRALETADLRGASDASEAARRIAAIAANLPGGAWAEGRGWDQNRWPGAVYPDARDLDKALGERPAVARRVDGHAVWVNTAALAAAGVGPDTRDPPGGRILRRADGSPSGVFVDNAMALVTKAMPAASQADFERWMLAATRACARLGLTEVQDASGYGPADVASLEKLAAAGSLPIRVYATVSPEPGSLAAAFRKGARVGRGADFLTVRAIKAYADGALGSRGAALLADYSDEPGNRGLLVTAPERLAEVARSAREHGWQLWIHAIGDRGNRVALDAFAGANRAVPKPPPGGDRPRIEHAQVIAPDDIPRFAKEGVIASIQPTHATSDMGWAEKRVGPERIAGAYAWRTLVRAGAKLAGGSDFPVESENPLLGFYAAITRQNEAGEPSGGWRPQERLSRSEALALFTSDAAWAAFEEDRRGRIAPGYEADLTVLAGDPMTAPAAKVASLPVVLTVVGGRVAWGRGTASGDAR
ncbi:MAG TPA: amidohydrolase [Thermoanaerobaculia bacterium]|nr:amidohydrolase [Thermoanaerobaculia bacterium]